MNPALDLPFFRHPAKHVFCVAAPGTAASGYPIADILTFAPERCPNLLAIRSKACFDRGLPEWKTPLQPKVNHAERDRSPYFDRRSSLL
jgi:hypothetical protein